MLRLFIICIVFLLLYLGFSIIENLDSILVLTLYNYHIETTFFVSIIFTILLLIASFIIIKIITLIIDLPIKIQSIFSARKEIHERHFALKAMAEYIMGNRANALSIAQQNIKLSNKDTEFYNLILSELEVEDNEKIKYLEELSNLKEFRFFSFKNLAILFYKQNDYLIAIDYAIKAYNSNELDSDVLVILIHCYGKQQEWEKLNFVVKKLKEINKLKFFELNIEIAKYYLSAAKLNEHNKDKAIYYLDLTIDLGCINAEILEFYLNLNANINIAQKIKIFKKAFNLNPSLRIVQMFSKFTDKSNDQIYEELTKDLINSENNLTLMLAMATYLNLPDKILIVKNQYE